MIPIHVAVSNYNTTNRLAATFESIARQTYSNYTLVVADACSQDGFEILATKYSSIITHVIREEDNGLYDGLSKIFSIDMGPGIYCYINAGDIYMPYAFEAVSRAFATHNTDWITGLPSLRNANGWIIDAKRPWPYLTCFLRRGFYNGKILPFVQQESVFWSYKLHRLLDLDTLKTFRYAGDFYMWNIFCRHSSLQILPTIISSFVYHGNHLSGDINNYTLECRKVAPSLSIFPLLLLTACIYGTLNRFISLPLRTYTLLKGVISDDDLK